MPSTTAVVSSPGALSARVGGTEFEDVGEQPFAQVGLDLDRHRVGSDFVQPGEQRPPADGDQDEDERGGDLRESQFLEEDSVDNAAQLPGLPDGQQAGEKPRENR